MTILRSATDPRWVEVALSDLDATLADHAHCEKKAVATAVKLVADNPERPTLVRRLAKLAQEELQHFLAMVTEVERRGREHAAGHPALWEDLVRGGKATDLAIISYTSGTTGFPKGAMITHRNTLFNVESCRATLGYRADDVGLVNLPLFHVTALHSQLVALLACGATAVLQPEYDTRQMLELVSRHRVTALFLVPAIYKLITLREDLGRYDLTRVRVAAYGGAPMDPETIRAIQRILPAELHNCYGLTECSSLGTVLPAELALSRAESVGRPVPGTEAQVRSESGEVLPPGEPGELHLRGPHIVRGYWGAPEKSRQAIRDGWLRTGDLARIDPDGLVTILDRVKDMINRGGEKIYGLEVENVLYAFPGVAEAAVVGVPHPVFGEVPAAFVVPMPGASLDPEAIRRHCSGRLADFKVPVAVRFLDALPRNPGGKVVKQALKRAWEAGPEEKAR
jgi:long-chain acyl-CoA synthetase